MNEEEELAPPLSKTPEPLQPRGQARDTGLGSGLGRALDKDTGGSCFLLQWEQKRGCSSRGRTGHLWLPRSGRAVFYGHILAQTMTRPGLLLATAWWRRFLISALRCAGCGRQTPTAGTEAVGSDLRVSTSRRRGEARARPASVQDADVVGADARVNDNTLLTNSLKKKKKKSTMATLRRAGGPGADFTFRDPSTPPCALPSGGGGCCSADFHFPLKCASPGRRVLRVKGPDSCPARNSRAQLGLAFI